MMAGEYLFEASIVYNTSGTPLASTTGGVLRDEDTGLPVTIYDAGGNAVASLSTNPYGLCMPFRADIIQGLVDFGAGQFTIRSIAAEEAGQNAQYAAAQAATSAANATIAANAAALSETAATSAASDAADAALLVGAPAGTAIDAHLGGDSTSVVDDINDLQTQPQSYAQLAPGSTLTAVHDGTNWYCGGVLLAARPTDRTDVQVHWFGDTIQPVWSITGDTWQGV